VGAGIIAASMLAAAAYADLPWYAGLIVAGAPVAGVLAGRPAPLRDRAGRRAAIIIGVAALVAGAGVGAAVIGTMEWGADEPAGEYEDYGY
jgi:hypothetical protein